MDLTKPLRTHSSVKRIFVTGATGFIGSAVVQELLRSGYQVTGLARSEEGARALVAAGVAVQRGALDDLGSLYEGAAASDGVIHTAFIHDFSKFKANCEIDRAAIAALGAGLAGSDRPLIVTSSTAVSAAAGPLGQENDPPRSSADGTYRAASEEAAMRLVAKGLHASIVRLPPSVHGDGDHAFVPALIKIAREKKVSGYIGKGFNRWPAVHRLDAATLFRLAFEAAAVGATYHGVADEGVPLLEIARVIGRRLNVPVVSKSSEEASAHFGWLAHFLALNCPTSSAQTQRVLGWAPTQPGLLADLDRPNYFQPF